MILDPLISTIFQNQRNQNFHTVQYIFTYNFISNYYYYVLNIELFILFVTSTSRSVSLKIYLRKIQFQ